MSKKRSPGGRLGQQAEAVAVLVGQQLVALLSGRALVQLQRGLARAACAACRAGRRGTAASSGSSASAVRVGTPACLQPGDLVAAKAGHQRQVVVGDRGAARRRGGSRRCRSGCRAAGRCRPGPALIVCWAWPRERAHVGGEVVGAVAVALAVAEQHRQLLRRLALQPLEQRRVGGQLHQEVGLGDPRQLGVGHAVAPVAQRGGLARPAPGSRRSRRCRRPRAPPGGSPRRRGASPRASARCGLAARPRCGPVSIRSTVRPSRSKPRRIACSCCSP